MSAANESWRNLTQIIFQMDVPINLNNPPKAATISIMDLGKQLLESAREGQTEHVNQLMCRGAPFTTDWVREYI